MHANVSLYAPGRGIQTRYDFISPNEWERVKPVVEYAVDATAGVYRLLQAAYIFIRLSY